MNVSYLNFYFYMMLYHVLLETKTILLPILDQQRQKPLTSGCSQSLSQSSGQVNLLGKAPENPSTMG